MYIYSAHLSRFAYGQLMALISIGPAGGCITVLVLFMANFYAKLTYIWLLHGAYGQWLN